jgi:hypothetical protein
MMRRRNRKRVLTTSRKRPLSYRISPLLTLGGSSKMMKMKRVTTLHSPICKNLISRWKRKSRKRRSLRPLSYLPNLSSSNRDKLLSSSIKPHRGRQINLNSRPSIYSTRRLRLVPPYPKI